jgi:hypothetical protein
MGHRMSVTCMTPPQFSVVVIAKDEAKTLPKRLLPSLAGFLRCGGQVVLLDTGSQDGTPDIARQGGCEVHEVGTRFVRRISAPEAKAINTLFGNPGEPEIVAAGAAFFDFAEARNHAATLAGNDMVLIADCDEGFTRLDIGAINRLIEAGHRKIDIPYVHSHDAQGRPVTKFHRAVLYDRRVCSYSCCVHEVVTGPVATHYADESVIVQEHWPEQHAHRTCYLPGLAWDCFQHLEKDRQSHYFARELMWSGRPRAALAEFQRHMGLRGWPAEQGMSAVYCGDCAMVRGDEAAAVAWWHRAVAMVPDSRQPWMRLAQHYYRKANHQLAACHAAAALEVMGAGHYFESLAHYRALPHEILYVSLWWLGDRERSKRHWQEALRLDPTHPKYVADGVYYPTPAGADSSGRGCLASVPRAACEGVTFPDCP